MNISLIIFCFNEAGSIGALIEASNLFLTSFSNDFELIVVDDGSTDSTSEILKKYTSIERIKIIKHDYNKGIGEALQTGYNIASKEYICAIPGDGQFDITELNKVSKFENTTYYSFYRITTNYSSYRAALTWLNRLFNQHILGIYIRDVNWVKVYRKEQLKLVSPRLRSSLVESEICAKLYKCKIMPIEIPSNYLIRKFGISKGGSWKTLKKAVFEISNLVWVIKKFKSPKQFNK